MRFAIITVSNSMFENCEIIDTTAEFLHDLITDRFRKSVTASIPISVTISADDCERKLRLLISKNYDFILTIGATGLLCNDFMPQLTVRLLDKVLPALSTFLALKGGQIAQFSLLSRCVWGLAKRSLIINLPENRSIASGSLQIISEIIEPAYDLLKNDQLTCNHLYSAFDRLVLNEGQHSKVPIVDSLKSNSILNRLTTTGFVEDELTFDKTEEILMAFSRIYRKKSSSISLNDSLNRILFEDIFTKCDYPAFACSSVDGYATTLKPSNTAIKTIENDNCCVRVTKGAHLPFNTQSVIPVDESEPIRRNDTNDQLNVSLPVDVKIKNIREIGCDFKKNTKILNANQQIGPKEIATLALNGHKTLNVYKRLLVGIVSIVNYQPHPDNEDFTKLSDSSHQLLIALLKKYNLQIHDFGTVQNLPNEIFKVLKTGFDKCDVIIVLGGGTCNNRTDYLRKVLVTDFDAEIEIDGVRIRPGGESLMFAVFIENKTLKPIFCLCEYPIGIFVTFYVFVVQFLKRLEGYVHFKFEQKDVLFETNSTIFKSRNKQFDEYHCVKLSKHCDGKLVAVSVTETKDLQLIPSLTDIDALLLFPSGFSDSNQYYRRTKAIILD